METSHRALTTLGHHIADLAPGAREIAVEYPLSASTRRDIETAATRAEVIVVGTLNAVIDPDQVALLESLRAVSARLVVIAMRTPYDLMRVPWVETYLCAYSTVGPVMRATAEVLFGERAATGTLPIEIPGLYPRGSGLQSGSSAVTRRD